MSIGNTNCNCKLNTGCNYVSHITLIKRGFVHECFYVKIVMLICMYKEETKIKKYNLISRYVFSI